MPPKHKDSEDFWGKQTLVVSADTKRPDGFVLGPDSREVQARLVPPAYRQARPGRVFHPHFVGAGEALCDLVDEVHIHYLSL